MWLCWETRKRCMVVKLYPSINLIDGSCRQARMQDFSQNGWTLPESHSGSFSFWRYSGVDAEVQSKKAAGQPFCIPLNVFHFGAGPLRSLNFMSVPELRGVTHERLRHRWISRSSPITRATHPTPRAFFW